MLKGQSNQIANHGKYIRHGHESLEMETKIGWDLDLDLKRSTSMRVMRVLAMGRFNLSIISQI